MSRGLRLPSINALAGTNARVHEDPLRGGWRAALKALDPMVEALKGIDEVAAVPVVPKGGRPFRLAMGALRKQKMNSLEAAYERVLRRRKLVGEVIWYDFEGITLKLADDTRFTPDFPVLLASGFLEMHETKGRMREDAWLKLKMAAKGFPFRFFVIKLQSKKLGGGWVTTEV